MHAVDFIQDLAVIMLVAGVVTVIFHRLKQPVVLGYIVAGVIIGPHTPPFDLIHEEATIHTLAELGVIFLLFFLGLEFSLKKLAQVGPTALIAAVPEIGVMIWVGYAIGKYFGWAQMDALFLGGMLAISSTTIIVKALDELGMKNERFAQLIFGILIVEDILAIGIIALLSAFAMTGEVTPGSAFATIGKLSLFMVVSLTLGILIVPRLLAYVAKFNNSEVLVVTVLGLCFGFCLLVVKLGYSVALGAFIIGAIMAEARELKAIERLIEPIKDMFSAIFFVAIGLMLDPAVLVKYAGPIGVITVALVLGKVVTCSLGAFAAGNDGRTSLRVGMGLSQIGEFAFIIATLGVTLKVTSDFLYPIAVAVSALTTLLTPYLIRLSDPLSAKIEASTPRRLARAGDAYQAWLNDTFRLEGRRAKLAKIIGRILMQTLINVAIVAAVFLAGAYLVNTVGENLVSDDGLRNAIVCGGALTISLPFLIAAYRKLKAFSMLLVELALRPRLTGPRADMVCWLVMELIPATAIAVILAVVALLAASVLPPPWLLLYVAAANALIAAVFWNWFVWVQARLQAALIETLETPSDPE